MITELRDFEYKLPKDGTLDPERLRYGAPEGEGFFDDSVMALALAVYGLKGEVYVPRIDVEEYAHVAADVPANQGYSFAAR